MFEMNLVMFRPYLRMFRDICGLPDQNKWKIKNDTKLTVEMCLQIYQGSLWPHIAAFFAGNRRWSRTVLSKTILDFRKCPNKKTHESESVGFLVWSLPGVQNCFWKQFLHKVLYNYYSEGFCGAFCLKKWRFKNWISHCILKMWFDHDKVTFLAKKKSAKAKHPKICVSIGVSMPIAQIKRCHWTPSPTHCNSLTNTTTAFLLWPHSCVSCLLWSHFCWEEEWWPSKWPSVVSLISLEITMSFKYLLWKDYCLILM